MSPIVIIRVLCLSCSCAVAFSQQQLPSVSSYSKNKFNIPDHKEILNFNELFKSRFRLSGFSTESSFIYNNGIVSNDLFTSTSLFQHNIRTVSGIEAFGIPFKAEYIRRQSSPSFFEDEQKDWYKFSMDVEKYKEKWKLLAERLGPESITRSGKELRDLKNSFSKKLYEVLLDKTSQQASTLLDSISQSIDPLLLEGKTPEEIQSLLFGQNIEKLLEHAKSELSRVRQMDALLSEKDSLITVWNNRIDELTAKSEYITKLAGIIGEAKERGVLDKWKDLDSRVLHEYDSLMRNPEQLIRNLANKYDVGWIGKIFTLLSQFKLGGQELPFSPDAYVPFLTKGISLELNIGDKFVGFSTGKIISIRSHLPGFNIPGALPDSSRLKAPSYWFIHFRKGKEDANHKGVRLTSIANNGSNDIQVQPTRILRKRTLLIDLYSKERIFGDNWLTVEASKSLVTDTYPKESIFNLNNVSIKIKAEGRFEPAGITHHVYFNKLRGAFNNLLQGNYSSDGYEAGFSFRMRPKGKKLTTYVKGSMRKFRMPGGVDSYWNHTNLRARFSYKLKKQSIQLSTTWQDGFRRYFFNSIQKDVRQQSHGITADLNLVNKRLFGLYNTSFISAGVQKDIFPITGVPGKETMVSYSYTAMLNQTFLLEEDLFQMNIWYTRVSQNMNEFLYNTRLDMDGGGFFKINQNVSAGLALVYGYFKGAYTNVGIKPSVSANLFKKMSVELNGDIRKNLKLENPLFEQFMNVNCEIRYTIK